MDLGMIVKMYILTVVGARWAKVLAGLKTAKFAVQDPKDGAWYVKFPCGTSPESFGDAVAAFLRKVLALVKLAAKV
jgi:hypothetical protein